MWATALHGIYKSVLIKFIFMTYFPVSKKKAYLWSLESTADSSHITSLIYGIRSYMLQRMQISQDWL